MTKNVKWLPFGATESKNPMELVLTAGQLACHMPPLLTLVTDTMVSKGSLSSLTMAFNIQMKLF